MFTGHFFLSSKLVSSIPSNLNYDFFNRHAHAQDNYFKFVSIIIVFFIHSGCIYKSTLVAPLSLGTFNIWKMHTHSVWWLMSWERQQGRCSQTNSACLSSFFGSITQQLHWVTPFIFNVHTKSQVCFLCFRLKKIHKAYIKFQYFSWLATYKELVPSWDWECDVSSHL